MRKIKARKTTKKHAPRGLSGRKLRQLIWQTYDGPTTDMVAAIRTMDEITKWIKTGELPGPTGLKLVGK